MALVAKYEGPFEGMDVAMPSLLISPKAATYINNWMVARNYIQSRPFFGAFPGLLPIPVIPDGLSIIGIAIALTPTYDVVSYNLYAGTGANLYYYSSGAWYLIGTWNARTGGSAFYKWDWLNTGGYFNAPFTNTQTGMAIVNGTQEIYWVPSGPTQNSLTGLTGGKIGARFIMEVGQILMVANVYEQGTFNFQQRVRWCNTQGVINQWDENANVGAGFADLLDASDVITGTLSLGSVGYIMRANGITQVTPTGNGTQPFEFNHMWASQMGIGQVFANTRAQYGGLAFIIAEDNVYSFSVTTFQTVGDKVIDQIIADIYAAIPEFLPYDVPLYACISPKYRNDYRYLCYKIFIGTNTRATYNVVWTYDITNRAWQRETLAASYALTGQPSFNDYINTSNLGGGGDFGFLLVPTGTTISTYDVSKLDAEMGGTYAFKLEEQEELGYVSVSWIGVTYVNIGIGTISVTLSGPSYYETQTLTLGDPTKTKAYYNGGTVPAAVNDQIVHVAFFSFTPLTDATFQVILGRAASSGPVKIIRVSVFGEIKEVSR